MSDRRLVFVDVETTGLDPDRHEIWEIALIAPFSQRSVYEFQRRPNLLTAEPRALDISRFYERFEGEDGSDAWIAEQVAQITAGSVLVGIGPWFDAAFLERFLRRNGFAPAWDHRLVCAKTLVVTKAREMALPDLEGPPWETRDVAEVLGVDRGAAHSALADARTALRFYEAAMGIDFGLSL